VSHIVTIKTEVRDPIAVASACRRLGLPVPLHGTASLYSGEATGLLVRLPGWAYPAVVKLETGAVEFDNFEGCWGDRAQLDRFLQIYTVEKARIAARAKGYSVVETALVDGSIRLSVAVGGDA
jgi:hypothetical protein